MISAIPWSYHPNGDRTYFILDANSEEVAINLTKDDAEQIVSIINSTYG